jgi:hypothetical protein
MRKGRRSTMRKLLMTGAVAVVVAALTFSGIAASASPGPARDVVTRGACSGSSHWKLDLSRHGTGRIEADMEVHSATAGQRWHFAFRDNGVRFGVGTRATQPDGSVDLRRVTANRTGPDVIRVRAKNLATSETCLGRARATF